MIFTNAAGDDVVLFFILEWLKRQSQTFRLAAHLGSYLHDLAYGFVWHIGFEIKPRVWMRSSCFSREIEPHKWSVHPSHSCLNAVAMLSWSRPAAVPNRRGRVLRRGSCELSNGVVALDLICDVLTLWTIMMISSYKVTGLAQCGLHVFPVNVRICTMRPILAVRIPTPGAARFPKLAMVSFLDGRIIPPQIELTVRTLCADALARFSALENTLGSFAKPATQGMKRYVVAKILGVLSSVEHRLHSILLVAHVLGVGICDVLYVQTACEDFANPNVGIRVRELDTTAIWL
mmetsp:Transcript_4012/g.7099  ORF Transcript_4012/g.7099 Transcript_4012/m.7099 type:complete len:290 (+) Transcript_4012:1361-2230(+)